MVAALTRTTEVRVLDDAQSDHAALLANTALAGTKCTESILGQGRVTTLRGSVGPRVVKVAARFNHNVNWVGKCLRPIVI